MNTIRIQLQKQAPVSYQEIALAMLAAALCAAGCAALFIPFFPHIQDSWVLYAVCGGVISASFCLLLFLQKGRWLTLSVSALVLLIFLIRFPVSRNGMLTLANDLLTFLTGRTGRIHALFQTGGYAGTLLIPVLYLLLLSLVIAAAFRKKRLLFPVLLLTLSAAAEIFQFSSAPAAVPLLALDTAVSLAACRRSRVSLRGIRAGFLALLLPAGFTAAAAVSLLLCAAALTKPGEVPFQTETAAGQIRHVLHTLRYESEGDTGMPEGDLRRTSASLDRDDAKDSGTQDSAPAAASMLRITMTHPEKLYLRGFTGDTYRDSVWSGPDSRTYVENAALFQALHTGGFYGQGMIAAAAEALGESGEHADKPKDRLPSSDSGQLDPQQTIVITSVGACRKYRYLPYALADSSILEPALIGDAGSPAAPLKKYDDAPLTVPCLSGSLPDWYGIALSLAENTESLAVDGESSGSEEYLRMEQAYCDYVMKTDRRLSEEATAFCAALFGTEKTERTLSEILTLVNETLDEHFAFVPKRADEIGIDAHSADALAAFAASGRGTSADFASAATVMLRYLGVPARYVEGYYLPGDEAREYAPGEEIELTQKHAHAWSEFYLRGIGWIPFEPVPGFRDNEELSELLSLSENSRTASSVSPLYVQSEILYTSGIFDTAAEPPQKPPFSFTWKGEYAVIALVSALSFLATLALLAFLFQRRRYRKAMEQIHTAKSAGSYAEAAAMLFGYASMLIHTAGLPDPPGLEKAKQINEKARFSAQKSTEEELVEMERFTHSVIRACHDKWSWKERVYYHWIRQIV